MKSLDASHDTNDSASTNHAEFVEDYRSTALRDALVETDQLERLRSAIQNLPQEQLDLLIATKVEGRSQKDIAEKMGISVQAVKNRLLRAKMALRELFESEPE
jgi:RNA polymerase sigma-70 factor (ECF subfamily)